MKYTLLLLLAITVTVAAEEPPLPQYHLTARPWQPLNIERDTYLDVVEPMCRHIAQYQDDDGAIIDPFLNREHQYSTPYFAFTVGVLVHAGRADDLLEKGVAAMDHATRCVEQGNRHIPDQHGEFFLAPLAHALEFYEGHVPEVTLALWRERLQTPLLKIIEGLDSKTNNWRTYAMSGEWQRVKAGLADKKEAYDFIEDAWLNRTQRVRIALDKWRLYQDWSSSPQSHAVEAVGRGNLMGLVHAGYDGPSAEAMRQHVERGTAASLLLQDPTGQCPPNGRTDDHVFNDVLYQLLFEVMAEREAAAGHADRAGQYRHAAMLGFQSIQRWQRTDAPFVGTYSITKNHFPIDQRVGYQPASNWTNYTGATMYHLAEAWLTRQSNITEAPPPATIGGYAMTTDPAFASAVANAGGMQVFINLHGDTVPKYGTYWTPLGISRLSRTGWDSRLGPSDGIYSREERGGITFGPTWRERLRWTHLAENAANYGATLDVAFVHPLLVRCTVIYHQETGAGGPSFYQELTITPDGVLSVLCTADSGQFGMGLPLLQNDGRDLNVTITDTIASTSYPAGLVNGDEQNFIALDEGSVIEKTGDAILSSYGYLLPLRQVNPKGDVVHTFVYPRNADEPTAQEVRDSFTLTEQGFSSVLGKVEGTLYTGCTAAGGYGDRIDLNGDDIPEVVLSQPCGFMVQHDKGRITAIETDSDVNAEINGAPYTLTAYAPVLVK